MHFYGDFIIPDFEPLEPGQNYTVKDVSCILENLGSVAIKLGLGEVWKKIQLIGLTCVSAENVGAVLMRGEQIGTSMYFACGYGVGFVRDFHISSELPPLVQKWLANENPEIRKKGQQKLSEYQPKMTLRRAEMDAIQKVAEAAKSEIPFSINVSLDISSSWICTFEEAYRRRLGYALAYEASLKNQSLEIYSGYFSTLIGGSLAEFKAICPPTKESSAFSIYLNLLASINEAILKQTDEGMIKIDNILGKLREASEKILFLEQCLSEAANYRMKSLNQDGCIAVKALLGELNYAKKKKQKIHCWGAFPSDVSVSELYLNRSIDLNALIKSIGLTE